ncbi:MAG: leucine--tRNA ligase, partial [Desulfobacterales bacterium]|nr:leucine--tRNA ligase [Desulfobacterales bacterium]
GFKKSILLSSWPIFREDALLKDELLIVIQINGKVRGKFTISADADDEAIKKAALSDDKALKFIDNKPIKKIFVIQKKLVNIVL